MATTNTNTNTIIGHLHNNNNNNANNKGKGAMAVKEDSHEVADVALMPGSGTGEQGDQYMSRVDVLKRRRNNLTQLSKIYRDFYWCLIEELNIKHREFIWKFGTIDSASITTAAAVPVPTAIMDDDHLHHHEVVDNYNMHRSYNEGKDKVVIAGVGINNVTNGNCEVHSCKRKAMALTRFCHSHILSDPNQVLYKGCNYPTKSSPSGSTLCMKPILKSAVHSLCSNHLEKAEKHMSQSLRKQGYNGSVNAKHLNPCFNVFITEFVHQIQTNRR